MENEVAAVLQKSAASGGQTGGLAEPRESEVPLQPPCQDALISHVRRIAVHVDEPHPGHFFWVLTEECDDANRWRELESAPLSHDSWRDALHAGVRALEGYAPDPRTGPRQPGEDEDADPVG